MSTDSTSARDLCRCGVYRYVHDEKPVCGNFRKANRIEIWWQHHDLWQHVAAPVWLRLPEKWRWRIVGRLDKSQRRCWADLVTDALAEREDDPCYVSVPELRPTSAGCADRCDWSHFEHTGEHDCGCYCGKFRFRAIDGYLDRRTTQEAPR